MSLCPKLYTLFFIVQPVESNNKKNYALKSKIYLSLLVHFKQAIIHKSK